VVRSSCQIRSYYFWVGHVRLGQATSRYNRLGQVRKCYVKVGHVNSC
jgi:hypothetical protein